MDALSGLVAETYVVGDALQPRNFLEAIKEGYQAALKV